MRRTAAQRIVVLVLAAAATVTTVTTVTTTKAAAPAADDAETLVTRGLELRRERRDAEALALFERAQTITPSPRTKAQIAFAEQALGLWTKAEEDLAAAMSAREDRWIQSHQPALADALEAIRRHLGSLEVRANVTSAELAIDGRVVGPVKPGEPTRVPIGRHVVEVRAPGHRTLSRTIDVEAGAYLRENFELVAADALAPGSAAPVASTPHVARAADSGSTQRTLGWSFFAAGIATGIFSGVAFAVSDGNTRAYNDDASCPGRASPSQPAPCADRISASGTWETIGIASAIGGGALAAFGLVLALTAPRAGHGASAFACTAASCGLRF
jgi:hypothetical protein